MRRLRILIADDHDVVRRGIRVLLEGQPEWEVVGEASSGREAVTQAHRLQPDIIIMDIGMPLLDGLEATRRILKALPRTEILIITMHQTEEMVHDVLEAGARGYVSKTDAVKHLAEAVRALSQHKPFLGSEVTGIVLDGYLKGTSAAEDRAKSRLSQREREIVQLLAEGFTNKEIASDLGITARTVETHRSNIMHKLNIHNVPKLVRYAIENKIVRP
jgi:DNA-binding NarL/FixJ family response regulator